MYISDFGAPGLLYIVSCCRDASALPLAVQEGTGAPPRKSQISDLGGQNDRPVKQRSLAHWQIEDSNYSITNYKHGCDMWKVGGCVHIRNGLV